MAHSILPPSSASIWSVCTGWVSMAQQYPETDQTVSASEGEASHEIGAHLIQCAATARPDFASERGVFVGTPTPSGGVYTDDMFDAAEMYADDVATVMHNLRNYDAHIEETVQIGRINSNCYGTPDCWLYDRKTHTLYLWDYKYGFLVVEAYQNKQAIAYLAGVIAQLGLDDQTLKVRVRIAQPRAHHRLGPIREWAFVASDLRSHINQLEGAAAEALSPNATVRTGGHCRYCQARHACAPALSAGVGLFELADKPVPVELTPQAIGVQLSVIKRALKQLEGLESAYEEQAKGLIRSGKLVPGWSTEDSRGRERWAKPIAEIEQLGDLVGLELRKPGVITPNQARKLGVDSAVIMAYSETPKTGLKLVPESSDYAREVFAP